MRSNLFTGILPFFSVAEEQSFRRAAEKLGVSTAAVSQSISRLEKRLGVKLLLRTPRAVSLTPEGTLFIEHCRQAIESVQTGHTLLAQSLDEPRGELRVALPFILGRLLIPRLIRISQTYPNLSFRFFMSDQFVTLAEKKIDIALRVGELENSSLLSRLLGKPHWVTVASPEFLSLHGTPKRPEELIDYNCLRFVAPNGRPRNWTFCKQRVGADTLWKVRGNLLIDHGDHLVEAALSGLGIVQVLDFMVEEYCQKNQLTKLLSEYTAQGPPIQALMAPERSRSVNVRAFLDFLPSVFQFPTYQTSRNPIRIQDKSKPI